MSAGGPHRHSHLGATPDDAATLGQCPPENATRLGPARPRDRKQQAVANPVGDRLLGAAPSGLPGTPEVTRSGRARPNG